MAFNHVDASRLSGAYNEPCLPHHYHHHHHHGFIINSLWATPCNFPITSAVVFVDSPGYTSWNYPGFLEASRGTIGFVGPLQETQSEQTKRRTCFLERSVFDLVKEHPYLDLTDPKLLGWYLSLTAQDRSIILDEGGFHRFLQRHPALGLTDHHVYVKFEYPNETSSLLSPSMSSSGHKYTSNTQNSLEMLQDNLKDHLCQQLVPQEDIFDTPSSGTDSQKPINMDPEGLENCSLDLALDQCFQKKNLEENSAMCGQSANIAANLAQANPLKSDQSFYNECYSEYCSCDSMESDDHDDSIENPIHLHGHPEPNRKKSTNDGPIQNKVGGEQDDRFKNILGEDTSMVCLDGKGTMGHQKDGHSGLAKAYKEAAVDASDIIKPGRTPENISVPSCNAVIGPDLAQSSPVSTQTEAEAPETADKNVMTELQISDLNFVYQVGFAFPLDLGNHAHSLSVGTVY
ncbi:uncharacterized protein LOC103391654 [Cynoglossus semilaevis]|uniref:uncharacterized protein LOC103391654 n=1 Tax=Cynoglossus semilaevis TaxID=244447 RepID=UPI000496AA82|nr:uncharacterized protein LOC103391654 [Cynoglossus semilaevis]